MQFNLKYLLAATAFVGFGCVALYNANEAWAKATMGLTIFILLTAILGAIQSNSRTFWCGVAVFGWCYLALNYVPPMQNHAVRPSEVTDDLLNAIRGHLVRDVPLSTEEIAMYRNRTPPPTKTIPVRRHFKTVGHLLLALTFAIVGGAVGHWFAKRE